ncbi:MAG: histidine phosphatase family protein [Coriobacteriia bacterium]|nr:histidine phosphatase family protein [Coriobacteriia bacterium]
MSHSEEKPCLTIYLMRHGDSRPDSVRRFIGQTDHALNDRGRAQAEAWGVKLSGTALHDILCSDLKRSIETAQIIGEQTGTPLTVLPELREIGLGSWDGMPIDEVRRRFPQEYALRGADIEHYRPPSGESFADLSGRMLPAFESAVRRSQGDLLIVGHAGVNRVILCRVLGMPPADLFRLEQEYGCLNVLKFAEGGWVVCKMNLTLGASQIRPRS